MDEKKEEKEREKEMEIKILQKRKNLIFFKIYFFVWFIKSREERKRVEQLQIKLAKT